MSELSHPMNPAFGFGRYTKLLARGALGSSTVQPLVMAVTGEYLTGHNIRHTYLTHEPLLDKQAYLETIRDEIANYMVTTLPPLRFSSSRAHA